MKKLFIGLLLSISFFASAQKKISQLPAASTLTGSELIENVQGGANKRTTTQAIANLYSLGYTAEDSSNKSTDGTLAANSDTLYPSQKAVKIYVDNKVPYKKFVASFTQSSTGAPTIGTTYQDDITGIVWTRSSQGTYIGTKVGAFLAGKVPKKVGIINAFYTGSAAVTYVYEISRQTDDTIALVTRNLTAAGGTDGLLNADTIEFVVYE